MRSVPGGSRHGSALPLEHVSGAVLCGGGSRRFGTDKALQRVAGRTLLERVVASLAPARERLLVGRAYPLEGTRYVADLRPGQGPLAGLEAALTAASQPWLALAACDLPCLTASYWRLLCRHADGTRGVVVRDGQGRLEPLAALYHRSALPEVRARLDRGSRDLQGLLQAVPTVAVELATVTTACGPGVLRNVNRPSDLPGEADPCRP